MAALLIAVRLNFSDAPRDQDNLLKLLTALSAIAAPSAGTLQNLCTFLVRVPALGAAMVESAVNAVRETKIFNKRSLRSLRSLVMLAARQERGGCGEHCGVTLQLSFKQRYYQTKGHLWSLGYSKDPNSLPKMSFNTFSSSINQTVRRICRKG